ncbi:MAG: hypothetical protein KDE08_11030 [Rhodobacteraceae bacterium]|nr:hypothetical protein [Paracoccaceae bacterium]
MDKIYEGWHWLLYVPTAFFVCIVGWLALRNIWNNDYDRPRIVRWLEHDSVKAYYVHLMTGLLDRVDARMSASELEDDAGPWRRAWSADLATLMLILAIAYPLLAFLTQWIAGYPMTLGDAELAAVGTGTERVFSTFLLSTSIVLYFFGIFSKSRWRAVLFIAPTAILYGGPFFADRLGIPGAFAGAIAVAVAGAVAGAIAIAGGFKIAGAVAGAFAGAVAVAVAGAGAGGFKFAGAGAGAFAFAVPFAFVSELADRRTLRHAVWRFLPVVLMQVMLIVVIMGFWQPASRRDFTAYLVLFFGVLPFFNALADFASVGLTRHLLRKGLPGWSLKQGVLDAFGGAAIFFTLGFTLITYVHVIRPPDGPLLNLTALFEGLRDDPGTYWWLAFMLISTLLPTMIHVGIALLSGFLGWPSWLRHWIVERLMAGKKGSEIEPTLGVIALSAIVVLAFWLPFAGFYGLLKLDHGWLLDQVIGVFEGYARLIGAI